MNDLEYEVKATNGDTHLGGEDFDNLLVNYLVNYCVEKFEKELDKNDKGLMSNLKKECEAAKRILSNATKTLIHVPGTSFCISISRAQFENLCMDLFEKSIKLVEEALQDAKMSKDEIDEVVLVGGSSRIPRIQEMLSDFFDGKELNKTINPDEIVAQGAAIEAGRILDHLTGSMRGLKVVDVCPLSLGTGVKDGSVTCVIKRNTPIPTKQSKNFFTPEDNTTSVEFAIYEGERLMQKDNHPLGKFTLDNIPPAPRGFKLMNTYEINENGILKVIAKVVQTGHERELTIINKCHLSESDAELAFKKAATFRADDERNRKRLIVWNEFDKQLYDTNRLSQNMSEPMKTNLSKKVQELTKWINNNNMATIEELQEKQNEFKEYMTKKLYEPIA